MTSAPRACLTLTCIVCAASASEAERSCPLDDEDDLPDEREEQHCLAEYLETRENVR